MKVNVDCAIPRRIRRSRGAFRHGDARRCAIGRLFPRSVHAESRSPRSARIREGPSGRLGTTQDSARPSRLLMSCGVDRNRMLVDGNRDQPDRPHRRKPRFVGFSGRALTPFNLSRRQQLIAMTPTERLGNIRLLAINAVDDSRGSRGRARSAMQKATSLTSKRKTPGSASTEGSNRSIRVAAHELLGERAMRRT